MSRTPHTPRSVRRRRREYASITPLLAAIVAAAGLFAGNSAQAQCTDPISTLPSSVSPLTVYANTNYSRLTGITSTPSESRVYAINEAGGIFIINLSTENTVNLEQVISTGISPSTGIARSHLGHFLHTDNQSIYFGTIEQNQNGQLVYTGIPNSEIITDAPFDITGIDYEWGKIFITTASPSGQPSIWTVEQVSPRGHVTPVNGSPEGSLKFANYMNLNSDYCNPMVNAEPTGFNFNLTNSIGDIISGQTGVIFGGFGVPREGSTIVTAENGQRTYVLAGRATNALALATYDIGSIMDAVQDQSAYCVLGDVDNSRAVDLADLTRLLACFGALSGDPLFDSAADFDSNQQIDLADLTSLLAHFGESC